MKFFNTLLPFAALTIAFVIPDDQTISQIAIERNRDSKPTSSLIENTSNLFDQAIDYAGHTIEEAPKRCHAAADKAKSWIDTASAKVDNHIEELGHHGHHGHKPNMTIYELIAKSKYTTKLAALINEYPDLVELLNGTTANFTVFAPIDKAFEKIPEHAPKPSKDEFKQILFYHISKDFYPAGRVLVSHTIPTYLVGDGIGGEAQRLATEISLRGLTVNFYSRIIAIDIFASNGVIHGIDSILTLPPKVASIIEYLPGEFSTLELGLTKTGLFKAINDTSTHVGGTLFAPSNFAFQKLGPKINGFLFSKYGQKYLKALLKYHVVANQTLYSDAYYKASSQDVDLTGVPKGYFHIDLPTLLDEKSLSIDIARYGRIITIKINGFATVTVPDGVGEDGVIHLISDVLIPPKSLDGHSQHWQGEELSEDDLKERLEPFVEVGEL